MIDTILILHGWGSSAKNWSRVKKFLEQKGKKVFVPDLPGFGLNPAPKNPWSVSDYSNWLEKFCRENNLSKFFLAGHSFGGGIAVKFAINHSESIQGLILINPAIIRIRTIKYYLSLAVAKSCNLILSLPLLSKLKPFLRRIFYWLLGTRDYQRLDLNKTTTMKETFRIVVSEDLSNYLPAVQSKTLVIWGEKDKVTPIEQGYCINGRLPYSRMEIIKGAKHGINLEMPDVLAEKILNFIKQ